MGLWGWKFRVHEVLGFRVYKMMRYKDVCGLGVYEISLFRVFEVSGSKGFQGL